ncbi:MAG: SO_0444 family Cu/Zn efflux transporter [Muribaculaceae bacterium]|nr:SO_0444 family Cu/Zn efflux transporter [Muribaculaceae bacterium]
MITVLKDYVMTLVTLVNQMSPYLLFGFLIAGVLHAFVPHSIYARHLGGNDWKSIVKAAILGIPLPLCSCGVIPTTVSLRKNGASRAASTSFLIATPQTGVDSIAATYSLLGLGFAIVRPVVALVTAMLGGKLVQTFGGKTDKTDTEMECDSCGFSVEHTSLKKKIVETLKYGFINMMQDVGKWLLIGLLLAALISVLVPDDFFARFATTPLVNMLIVLAIAVPMYICATGSIPVALTLMMKGLSPGAALVLLMAGPATNIASILVIGKVFGKRTTLVYLISIMVGALGFGLLIDYALPLSWFKTGMVGMSMESCHAMGASPISITCSIAFVALLMWAFISKFINSVKLKNNSKMKKEYQIKGMVCNHCKANVEKNLAKVAGVNSVTVDLERGIAYVDGNPDDNQIAKTVNDLGYEFVK